MELGRMKLGNHYAMRVNHYCACGGGVQVRRTFCYFSITRCRGVY